MEEWKEYKLKDICIKITDGSHSSPKAQEKGYPMLSVKDMLENDFDYSKCKLISHEDFISLKRNDCVPQRNDILVAKDGSFLKQIFVCKEEKEIGILSSIAIFRPNPEVVNPNFLCFLLKSPQVYNYITNNCVSGSALPRIVLKDFKEIDLRIPSLKLQNGIVDKLLPINDKIECNRKICENLEEQAQALFKSWFVDFEPFQDGNFVESELGMIPEGWKTSTLNSIASITMGQSPSGSSYNENGDGIVFYQGRAEFGNRFPSIRLYTTEPKRYAEPFSILLSVRAPVGDINIVPYRCCIGRGLAALKSRDGASSFLLYTVQHLKAQMDAFNGEGTVFGSINKQSLEELKVLLPPSEIIERYEALAKSLDIQIYILSEEISRLTQLRDTLLPKLMSGKLQVEY